MNKLVSKNPVQRFKEGRKILFAKPGDKMLYNGKEVVTEETLNGQTIYRRKNGSYVYKNSKLLSPIKSTSKPKTTSRIDQGSSEVNRFAIASRKNGTRYFDTAEKAKTYQKTLPSGSSIFRDMGEEWKGSVVKADRTKGKDAVATSYGRNQVEKYNNLSQKDAYKAAQKSGNKYFAYRGKVYKTDLKDGKDNMTEMQGLYGTHLGWGEDPKLQNKQSRTARENYRSQIDAKQGNRRPSYQGKTNSQANAEADKKVEQTWGQNHQVAFWDALMPTNALGNAVSAIANKITNEEYHPEIYASGFNPLGYAKAFTRVLDGDVAGGLAEGVVRGIDAYTTLGMPGVSGIIDRTMTRFAPRLTPVSSTSKYIPKSGLQNGTLNKWNWNSLARGGNNAAQSSWNKGVKIVTEGGRRSMQRAADEGFQFTGFKGADKAAQLATNFGQNPNTGTAFFFRGAPTTYDIAADRAVQIAPWLGVPANVSTQQLYNNQ